MNSYPLLEDGEKQKYLLLSISYKENNKEKYHDLKGRNKDDVLRTFNKKNKSRITNIHEKRVYLSDKKQRDCYYKNSGKSDIALLILSILLCIITLGIAIFFLANFFRRFAKSCYPQEKQFYENFQLSYIENSDIENIKNSQNILTKITIHHNQDIKIKNAKIIRIKNHITCYENLNLEDKKLEEILDILCTIPGNPKIKLNYKVNYNDINCCGTTSVYWTTMSKKELIKCVKNGFDLDQRGFNRNSWR